MDEGKRNRIVGAVTVNIILLIFILAVVIVYQLINIVVVKSRIKDIKGEINSTTEQQQQLEGSLDYYMSDEYLELKAFEQGYVYPDD